MDDHDERIRKRAHEIWEEEGRPEGREYSHWLRARADVNEADVEASQRAGNGFILRPDLHPAERLERTSKADIARSTLPPGTVPENPTAENPDRITRLKPAAPRKPLDARDIDTQLDQPF
jgi:hypothetical protein